MQQKERQSNVYSDPHPSAESRPPRFRTAVMILLVQAALIRWTTDSEIARDVYLICYALMMPTVLYLLAARVFRKWLPFDDRELLLGYIVLTATIPIVGFGGLRFIMEGVGYLAFFSQTQPLWEKYLPSVARLPVLHDPRAIRDFYTGGAASVPWGAWAGPIAFWSAYLLFLSALWLCLAGLLRRIWIHQERLTFPIAMIPVELSDARNDIFRNRLFWIGFVIVAVIQSLSAIHYHVPTVPAVQMKAQNMRPLWFTSPPWSAIPDLNVGWYPMAIGLAYFVPSDVSFSCWFFAIAMRLSYVVAAASGWEPGGVGMGRFPFKEEQAAGAWIGFALLVLWGARHQWKTVAGLVPAAEMRGLRWLMLGSLLCVAACAAMMSVCGIPPLLSGGLILVYAAYALTGARVRAEAGGQWTFAPAFWTPNRVMNASLGTEGAGMQGMVASGHFDLIHNDIRAVTLPFLMEGLDIAERTGIRWRTVLLWVAAGTLSALALGWYFGLTKLYALGAATAKANDYPLMRIQRAFNEVERAFIAPAGRDWAGMGAMAFGAGLTALLAWSRRLGVLALSPVGYVLCNTYTMNAFVVPFFIAWAAKVSILRFFGNSVYRQSIPFFVGVALGDIVTQAGWALAGWAFNVPVYQFLS